MSNILDLSVFQEQYMEVKMPDGTMLKLSKPTQKMVIELLKFQNLNENSAPEEIVDALDKITLEILSTDKNGTKVTIADLNIRMKLALIQEYSKFITEVQSNPN